MEQTIVSSKIMVLQDNLEEVAHSKRLNKGKSGTKQIFSLMRYEKNETRYD